MGQASCTHAFHTPWAIWTQPGKTQWLSPKRRSGHLPSDLVRSPKGNISSNSSYASCRSTLTVITLSYQSSCSCYSCCCWNIQVSALSFPSLTSSKLDLSYLHTFSFICLLKLISASRSVSDWALSCFLGGWRARPRTEKERPQFIGHSQG